MRFELSTADSERQRNGVTRVTEVFTPLNDVCLLYTSDAADERSSVDLGGRRIIKKKKNEENRRIAYITITSK